MKNKILIKLAIFLLRRVEIGKLQYRNSFRHYLSELEQYGND
jgi:hypothetical protein